MSDKSREYYSVTQMVQELIDSVEELTEEIEEVDPSTIDAKITAVDAKVARNAADIETNEGLITQLQVRATADEQAITGLDTRVAKLEEGGTAGGYTVTTETYTLDVSAGTGSTKATFEDMRNGGFIIIQPYDDDAKELCEKSVEIKVTQEFALLPTYTFTFDTKGREVYYAKFLIIKATKKDDTTLKTINRVPRYLNTAWSGSTLVPSVDLITWNNDTITAVSATDYPEVTELTLPYYKPNSTTDKAFLGGNCSFSFNNITTLNVLTSYYNCNYVTSVYLPATITKLRFNYFPIIKTWSGPFNFVFPRDCSDIEWSHFNADGSFKSVFSTSLNAQLIVKNHIEDFNSLNSIKEEMFYNCPDVNLEITQDMFTGANSIDSKAFQGSALKSIDSNVVGSVPYYGFAYCSKLKTVRLPYVTSGDYHAFEGCNLDKCIIPNFSSSGNSFYNTTIGVLDSSLSSFDGYNCHVTKAFISRVNSVCDFTNVLRDSSGCILYVPDDLYDSYIASDTYTSYVNRIKKISEYTE